MQRKCSFRYMVLELDGTAHILTQDIRRSVRVVTGCIYVGLQFRDRLRKIAKDYGCSVIFRPKGYIL